jgi:hypothetical protein
MTDLRQCSNDPEYLSAFVTIFDIPEKWLTKTLDGASDINQSIALDSFINDPTLKQHFPKALCCITMLLERLACFSTIFSPHFPTHSAAATLASFPPPPRHRHH